MSERLFAQLAALLEHESVVLATVLDTRGAVPRHRGAQMLITSTQTSFSVGGGQLEARVVERARQLLRDDGDSNLVAIDLTGRPGGEGICGGVMRVALRRWQGDADHIRAGEIVAALHDGQSQTLQSADLGAEFVQVIAPDPRLLIIGAGHCGLALHRAAGALDFDMHVFDARIEGYEHADFIGACCHDRIDALATCLDSSRRVYAVLLNRDYHADVAALRMLATRPPAFVGMMGSGKRIAEVFAALPELRAFCTSVVAPVGIDIGAETPAEIAISILAQLIAQRRAV